MLEDRRIPATFGLSWPDPSHLSLSYLPNGATAANTPIVINYNLKSQTLAVTASLYDSSGQLVLSLNAIEGSATSTGNVNLPTGQYVLALVARHGDGSPPSGALFGLSGTYGANAMGPDPIDPINPPRDPFGTGRRNPYGIDPSHPDAIPSYATLNDVYTNPWL